MCHWRVQAPWYTYTTTHQQLQLQYRSDLTTVLINGHNSETVAYELQSLARCLASQNTNSQDTQVN